MMDLYLFVLKCAHAVLKSTPMDGFISLLRCDAPPRDCNALGTFYYRGTESFIFWALPDHFHSQHVECLSARQFPPPLLSLSLSTAGLLVSLGSCFSLWFGSSGWPLQRNQLDLLLFPAHTSLFVHAGVIPGGPLG